MRRFAVGTVVSCAVVVAWMAVAAWAGPLSGKLSEVATNDNAAFLPSDAEATRARELGDRFAERPSITAVVVFERSGGLTEADRHRVNAEIAEFSTVEGVVAPLPPAVLSADGQALQAIVPIDEVAASHHVDAIVERLRTIAPSDGGLAVHVTGPAGMLGDLLAVFKSIDLMLLAVTAAVVLVILLIVYRSPILWIIPLICA